jgi:two-component system, sensor histidine kinase and response regulator
MLAKQEGVSVTTKPSAPKILIVEDHEETAHAISEFLILENFSPVIAKDVLSALQILKADAPDIILSDIYMPGKSGIDLFTELKNNPLWSDIPFIILSGKDDEKEIFDSIRLGCDHFVKKPVNPGELKALLTGKLKQIEVRKQLEYLKLEHFKKKIIHTLSHEFRTPLVSITTGAELLLEDGDKLGGEQVRNLLKSILRGGMRLERLVEDFMLVQQIEMGKASESYNEFVSPMYLGEFMLQLKRKEAELYSEIYPERIFNYSIDPSLLKIKVDMFLAQLTDAFIRIIDNSYKFSPHEQKCMISVTVESASVMFSIRDWGTGLPQGVASQKEALEKFIQINREVHEQQGCGIGLSIASYFISLHNGTLHLMQPKDGSGLEVLVNLPVLNENKLNAL